MPSNNSESAGRRRILKSAIGAGVVGLGAAGGYFASRERRSETEKSGLPEDEPVIYFDLSYLREYDFGDPERAAQAYEHMHLVSTLQGNVNRDVARLFVNFGTGGQLGKVDIDEWWFDELRREGEWLHDQPFDTIDDLDELVVHFDDQIHGAVVYDPSVAATSNVASTVAGVEELVAVRYDTRADSLYTRYVAGENDAGIELPVETWLVDRDGSSRFTGRGTIPGVDRRSTGSAKCDAYVWAKETYLDAGRCNPNELGYYLDSYWLDHVGDRAPGSSLLLNHDYLVARRGFVFDLFPWDDAAPIDDPEQPTGTDRDVLEEILRSSYEQSDDEMTAIHGFVPWGWKYTSYANEANHHEPVSTEWKYVQVASAYNAYVDADAHGLDPMANASLFRHYPLDAEYEQNPKPTTDDFRERGYLDEDGTVDARRYVAFYVGDYDSAAWLYRAVPQLWEDPQRGEVPLNWAFNPNLERRMGPAMAYTRRTRTENDYFISGPSGAGYLNPGMLAEPRRISDLLSGLEAWTDHCRRYFEKWDLSATGFVIDGHSPTLEYEKAGRSYAEFSPDGAVGGNFPRFGSVVEGLPILGMHTELSGHPADAADDLGDSFAGDLSDPPRKPEFYPVRTILQSPGWHAEVVEHARQAYPDAAIEFVDYYTLLGLARQTLRQE